MGVLTEQNAAEVVESLDLGAIPACPLCLFDLAWTMHTGTAERGLVRRTCSWVWPEIEGAVDAAVRAARMHEVPHAEKALDDIRERGGRGLVARRVVMVLARRLADQFGGGPEAVSAGPG
jgi:hypothetical protein